ncbi:alpha/beta hydrolase [Novosphingobium umbonatum]|uniref:Alpha/beta hydrolase n=1 Tax=Novosphingobium umbonatum TaxID=1908524 RepID=A0A437N3K2_9SPHN|nr:alpha/beta hydrolase [Novosphingobium umbonatum]RVU04495.1 alpha/beta hydrolase [Novosphingobium umbonatum]
MKRLAWASLFWATSAMAAPGAWVDGVLPVNNPPVMPAVDLPVSLPRANPAHEAWAQQTPDQRLVYNVVTPQILPWPSSLPKDATAPAVLLVPGGGYQFLAMDNEGFDVAKRLDKQGVRVFIVKYRTLPLPDSFAGFKNALAGLFQRGERPASDNRPYAVADTQAAIRYVRGKAAALHVDPAKVGILGFSAGAMTVLATTQANAVDARPDFVGMVYGPTQSSDVPPKAPPLFAVIAADDRFFKDQDLSLIHNWRLSGSGVEFHLYSAGGHGFASQPNGTTSDAWFDQFALWMKASGITAKSDRK